MRWRRGFTSPVRLDLSWQERCCHGVFRKLDRPGIGTVAWTALATRCTPEEPQQGRFPGTGGSDQRDDLPGCDLEVETPEHDRFDDATLDAEGAQDGAQFRRETIEIQCPPIGLPDVDETYRASEGLGCGERRSVEPSLVQLPDRVGGQEAVDQRLGFGDESAEQDRPTGGGVPQVAEARPLEEGVVARHHRDRFDERLGAAHFRDAPLLNPAQGSCDRGVAESFAAVVGMDDDASDACSTRVALGEGEFLGKGPELVGIGVRVTCAQLAEMTLRPIGRFDPVRGEDEATDVPDEVPVGEAPVHDRERGIDAHVRDDSRFVRFAIDEFGDEEAAGACRSEEITEAHGTMTARTERTRIGIERRVVVGARPAGDVLVFARVVGLFELDDSEEIGFARCFAEAKTIGGDDCSGERRATFEGRLFVPERPDGE